MLVALVSPLFLVGAATIRAGVSVVKEIIAIRHQFCRVIYFAPHENHRHGRGGKALKRDSE